MNAISTVLFVFHGSLKKITFIKSLPSYRGNVENYSSSTVGIRLI